MQKPYRGDYKPDYEKWKEICKVKSSSIFVILIRWIVFIALIGFIASYFFDKPNFEYYYDFWEHSIPIEDEDYWFSLIFLQLFQRLLVLLLLSLEIKMTHLIYGLQKTKLNKNIKVLLIDMSIIGKQNMKKQYDRQI